MIDLSKGNDAQFWAGVRNLLAMDGVDVGSLADYVHEEAERRDGKLARLRAKRSVIYAAAVERALAADPSADPLDAITLTAAEDRQAAVLWQRYSARFHQLADAGGPYVQTAEATAYCRVCDLGICQSGHDDEGRPYWLHTDGHRECERFAPSVASPF